MFKGMDREVLTEEVTSEQRLKEGVCTGNSVLARGNRMCKDLRAEAWLACVRSSEKVRVAEEERQREKSERLAEALQAAAST